MYNFSVKMLLRTVIITALAVLFTSPALSEDKGIATLYSFDGDVSIKSGAVWGVPPQNGMPIYHGDKFLTGADSIIRIRFHDGSLLDILPNSNVRVAEIIGDEGLSSRKDTRKREIRVFLGTVLYKSSPESIIKTKLVSPKSAAIVPSGSENRFGTDGTLAFINRSKKDGEMLGNITEGKVPETTVLQAKNDENYQSSLRAGLSRQAYLEAVKQLMTAGLGNEILIASNSDSVNAIILAGVAASEAQKKTADEVLILGAKYSIANNENLLIENKCLRNNPDEEVSKRAEKGIRSTQEAIGKGNQALQAAIQTAEKIEQLAKTALTGGPEQVKEAFKMLQPVLHNMIEEQKEVNAVAMGKGKVADVVTAGIVGDIRKIEEKEMKKAKEEIGSEVGDGVVTQALVKQKLEEKEKDKDKKDKDKKDKDKDNKSGEDNDPTPGGDDDASGTNDIPGFGDIPGPADEWKPDIDNKPKPYGQ
jgi:hypothetical protein